MLGENCFEGNKKNVLINNFKEGSHLCGAEIYLATEINWTYKSCRPSQSHDSDSCISLRVRKNNGKPLVPKWWNMTNTTLRSLKTEGVELCNTHLP